MAVKASVTITISKYRDTDSITRYYKLQASTAAAPAVPTTLTPSGWSTSEPTYTSGSTNTLYYTDCIVFSDGTFQYTDDGNGKAVKSSSYEAAKEAYNKAQAAQDSINDLNIGGRNLLLDSKKDTKNKITYKVQEYTLSEDWIVNEEYTLSIKGNVTNGKFGAWRDFGSIAITYSMNYDEEKDLWWYTFKCPAPYDSTRPTNILTIYNTPDTVEHNSTIEWIKLEKGNMYTDWSPAPEDIDSAINTAQSTADTANTAAINITDRVNDKENNFNFKYHLDVVVYGESNKFYPVIIKYGNQDIKRTIMVKRSYAEQAPSDWNKSTHPGALVLKILCNFGGWGGANYSWEIHELEEMYSQIFGGAMNCGNNCMFAIFLRGGGTTGAKYHLYSDMKLDQKNIYDYGWDEEQQLYIQNKLPSPQISYRTNYIQYKSDLCFGYPGNKTPVSTGKYEDLQYKIDAPAPRDMVTNGTTDGGFTRYVRTSAQNEEIRIRRFIKLSQDNDTILKKTVKKVDVEYYLSTSSTTLSGGSWSTTAPTWVDGKYMWSRQKVTFVDNTTSTTNTTCIAGAKGSIGKSTIYFGVRSWTQSAINSFCVEGYADVWAQPSPGIAVKKDDIIMLAVTNTTTNKKGQLYIQVTADTAATSSPPGKVISYIQDGENGQTGSTGTGINSITEEYYLSTSKTTQTGGSWVTNPPTWESGKYIWTRSKIVYKNPVSTAYTTPLCSSEWEAVNELDIGGRNLIRNSGNQISNDSYKISNFELTEKMIENELYSIRIWGELGENKTNFSAYINGGAYRLCDLTNNGDGTYSGIFKGRVVPTYTQDIDYIQLYTMPNSVTSISTINKIKLEKGNKLTDWTPAPEDIDENIETVSAYAQNVANELLTAKGQLTAAATRIDSLQGIIENFVKDDNGMVTVTQTGSGMQIDMTQATNRINQLLTAIESAVTEGEANQLRTELLAAIQAVQSRTAYINATQDAQGRPVITLGATDSPFKVEITNEAINFIQNGQVIAYANGQKFYNLRTVVQQDVQIGIGPGFIWKTRDSGNMGLTWVPAQS